MNNSINVQIRLERIIQQKKFKFIWNLLHIKSRFNPFKEILEQRTKEQIINDILQSTKQLQRRIQPTNNKRIGIILILLQTIIQIIPSLNQREGQAFRFQESRNQERYINKLNIIQS